MPKPRDFNPHPKLWHPCCLVTVDCGTYICNGWCKKPSGGASKNLSNGEIASRMNINKRTAELYIFKAFSHLRASYDKIYKPAE